CCVRYIARSAIWALLWAMLISLLSASNQKLRRMSLPCASALPVCWTPRLTIFRLRPPLRKNWVLPVAKRVSPSPPWCCCMTDARCQGLLRQTPQDFRVREQLGFEPGGGGEHLWLHLRKTGINTMDLALALAKLARLPVRSVGYSGLKDRHAVTE